MPDRHGRHTSRPKILFLELVLPLQSSYTTITTFVTTYKLLHRPRTQTQHTALMERSKLPKLIRTWGPLILENDRHISLLNEIARDDIYISELWHFSNEKERVMARSILNGNQNVKRLLRKYVPQYFQWPFHTPGSNSISAEDIIFDSGSHSSLDNVSNGMSLYGNHQQKNTQLVVDGDDHVGELKATLLIIAAITLGVMLDEEDILLAHWSKNFLDGPVQRAQMIRILDAFTPEVEFDIGSTDFVSAMYLDAMKKGYSEHVNVDGLFDEAGERFVRIKIKRDFEYTKDKSESPQSPYTQYTPRKRIRRGSWRQHGTSNRSYGYS
jgi:hypothetical protein